MNQPSFRSDSKALKVERFFKSFKKENTMKKRIVAKRWSIIFIWNHSPPPNRLKKVSNLRIGLGPQIAWEWLNFYSCWIVHEPWQIFIHRPPELLKDGNKSKRRSEQKHSALWKGFSIMLRTSMLCVCKGAWGAYPREGFPLLQRNENPIREWPPDSRSRLWERVYEFNVPNFHLVIMIWRVASWSRNLILMDGLHIGRDIDSLTSDSTRPLLCWRIFLR